MFRAVTSDIISPPAENGKEYVAPPPLHTFPGGGQGRAKLRP